MSSKPFLPSFYPVDRHFINESSVKQPNTVHSNHLLTNQPLTDISKATDSTKHLVSHKNEAAPAMLSISPIRYEQAKKTVYPKEQLETSEEDEKVSRLESDKTCTMSSLSHSFIGSNAFVANLSNQFVSEKTHVGHCLESPTGFNMKTEEDPIKHENDDMGDVIDSDPFYTQDDRPVNEKDFSQNEIAIKEEDISDLNANLILDNNNSVPVAFRDIPPVDPKISSIDESKLDDFSLHSNGSFDIDIFTSFEAEVTTPDSIGIHATKTARMNPNTKKSKRKKSGCRRSSRVDNEVSSTVVNKPTNLDILRGRGGLTNKHPGNMRFRDEARALRAEYRSKDTTRAKKFLLSQQLVEIVKDYGGRFLEPSNDGKWHLMSTKAERKKASQVLREEKWD